MSNTEIDLEKQKRKKLIVVIGGTLMIVGLIILITPKKKVKPKIPVIKPLPNKNKVVTKTITITPTEKTEVEEVEEEEIEEIETPNELTEEE